jgi:branched-subunit amino acid transport protein AzlD
MTDVLYAIYVIAAMAVVTFALRALPFLAAPWLRKYQVVQHLGRFLPLAIMTLLLLHSLVGAAKEHEAGPWPELLAAACVMLLQWKSRNPLLSIVVGTTAYVALRNMGAL